MDGTILFDPLLPMPVVWLAVALAAIAVGLAAWRRLTGWWLRAAALLAVLTAVLNPSVQTETRTPLSDIVLVVVDDSASQNIADRAARTEAALAEVTARIEARENTELRVARVGDGPDNTGTLLMSELAAAMAEEPRARIA